MSKGAMTVEAIMSIFLMIAVLVVGVSFLLRAFNIDLFGFLGDLLGGVIGVPEKGLVLYIRLDPDSGARLGGDGTAEVHAFSLIEQGILRQNNFKFKIENDLYFWPDPKYVSDGQCTIFLVDEGDEPNDDRGKLAKVKSGTQIDDEKCPVGTNLASCLSDSNAQYSCGFMTQADVGECKGVNCVNCPDVNCPSIRTGQRVACQGNSNIVYCKYSLSEVPNKCMDNTKVLDEKFCIEEKDKCVWYKDSCSANGCSLAYPNSYRVKYGVFCANDGQWYSCTKKNDGKTRDDLTCTKEGDSYVWKGTFKARKADAAPKVYVGAIPNVSNKIEQIIGRNITITAYADDSEAGNGLTKLELSGTDTCTYPEVLNDPPFPDSKSRNCDNKLFCGRDFKINCNDVSRPTVSVIATSNANPPNNKATKNVGVEFKKELVYASFPGSAVKDSNIYHNTSSSIFMTLDVKVANDGQTRSIIYGPGIETSDGSFIELGTFSDVRLSSTDVNGDVVLRMGAAGWHSLYEFHKKASGMDPNTNPTLVFSYSLSRGADRENLHPVDEKVYKLGFDALWEYSPDYKVDWIADSGVTLSFPDVSSDPNSVKHGRVSVKAQKPVADVKGLTFKRVDPSYTGPLRISDGIVLSYKGDGGPGKILIHDVNGKNNCVVLPDRVSDCGIVLTPKPDQFKYVYITRQYLIDQGLNPDRIDRIEFQFGTTLIIDGFYYS